MDINDETTFSPDIFDIDTANQHEDWSSAALDSIDVLDVCRNLGRDDFVLNDRMINSSIKASSIELFPKSDSPDGYCYEVEEQINPFTSIIRFEDTSYLNSDNSEIIQILGTMSSASSWYQHQNQPRSSGSNLVVYNNPGNAECIGYLSGQNSALAPVPVNGSSAISFFTSTPLSTPVSVPIRDLGKLVLKPDDHNQEADDFVTLYNENQTMAKKFVPVTSDRKASQKSITRTRRFKSTAAALRSNGTRKVTSDRNMALAHTYRKEVRHRPRKLCDVCSKEFRGNHELKVHYRIHTGEKPYPCDKCAMRFRQKIHLRNHLERMHSNSTSANEKILTTCSFCLMQFSDIQTLDIHRRSHIKGNRPVICGVCGQGFVGKYLLKLHINAKHPSLCINGLAGSFERDESQTEY